jgi:hypothetical protein
MFNSEQFSLSPILWGGSFMFERYRKIPLSIALFVGSFLAALAPANFATAHDQAEGGSSPYLIGHWKLNDTFHDFTSSGTAITTKNTEFVFLNPTNLKLTLEYAFFATVDADPNKKAVFCGCDRDVLSPNGRTRYTMLGEQDGKLFSSSCGQQKFTATDGTMKTIVFTGTNSDGTVRIDDALQAGYQIDVFGQVPGTTSGTAITIAAEAGLAAVAINDETKKEIQQIHKACVKFLGK